ncbi:hypothetical protein O1611_g23 [Lasiodiplodia mahajangana]|uniref:Uncharacterized protein n=1 Tax=Lasiodiplodia mahajangana TaxID=1108764 RepID=A0ACC2K1C6_9PEZI|nr:hypothetical protein O1611_g23 [Lasiodiplodia mahajangana]
MAASNITFLPLCYPQASWKLSVIVVPDFTKDGTAPDRTHDWVTSMMPPDGTQAQIARFEYRISMTGCSIWRQLSEKGEDLLRIFRHTAGTHQILERPIILVGYGFGGFIIKRSKALSILSNPMLQIHSKDILNMVAGVVFFGTPHAKTKQPEQWFRLTLLLNIAGKLPKRFIAQSESDANTAAIICEDFEQSGLDAVVLSIYETKPTRVRSGRWKLKDSVTIVDKAFAETWAKNEKLLGNNASHEDVGTVYSRSATQQEIGLLLMTTLGTPWHKMGANIIQDSSEAAVLGSSLPSNFDVVPSNDMGEYVEEELKAIAWPCYLWDEFESPRGFFGRQDTFQMIDDHFFASKTHSTTPSLLDNQRLPCCCISGLGGIGKTQTAIQYATTRRNEFDAIFIIQADNSAKLSEKFHKIPPALGLSDGVGEGEKGCEEADLVVNRSKALKWLSSPNFSSKALAQRDTSLGTTPSRKFNWLLVFDNVEDPSVLRDYWPFGNVGCILVTTRDARTSDYLSSQSHVSHITLDKLDLAPALELFLLLSHTTPNEINTENASVIVDKLGGLPLAIEHAAAYIHGKGMTLNEFLSLYGHTLLDKHGNDTRSRSWSYEVATSWALGSLSAAAYSLLSVCSFLDPDGVQDSILTEIMGKSLTQSSLADYPNNQLAHIDARGELLRSSLIRANMSVTPVVIRVHRLVQDIYLARMAAFRRIEVFTFVVDYIFDAWPFTENSWDHQDGAWAKQEVLLQHIFRLSHIAETYDLSSVELSLKRKFVTLLSSGGWYRQERGDFDSGMPLFELGVRLCADSPNDFLDLRADLSFGLGGATCDTNRWPEFLVNAQDQLDYRLRSDAAAGNLPTSNTAIAYSELGLAQALMGDYGGGVQNCDKAIQLYAKQPEVIKGTFFPAFPHIHRALALVGAGRPEEGERGLLELIGWHETQFGPRHTEFKLGYAWHCCGLIYSRTGRPNASIAAYNKAFANYQATVGSLYHRTGNVCGKIAEHHESLGQFEAADFFFNEAQKAYTSQLHYKPELARHYFILSQALQGRGDQEAANIAFQKAQVLYNEIMLHNEPTSMSLESLNTLVAPWVW